MEIAILQILYFNISYFIYSRIFQRSTTKTEYHNKTITDTFNTLEIAILQNLYFICIPPLPKGGGGYTVLPLSICLSVLPSFRPSKICFVAIFSVTVDGRNLIFGHKLHIGTPYRGKRFWTHQIPTSCLLTLLIFIHIEHVCSFFVAFFSATIDGRNLIFRHNSSYWNAILWEVFLDPSDSYFLFADLVNSWFLYTLNI